MLLPRLVVLQKHRDSFGAKIGLGGEICENSRTETPVKISEQGLILCMDPHKIVQKFY